MNRNNPRGNVPINTPIREPKSICSFDEHFGVALGQMHDDTHLLMKGERHIGHITTGNFGTRSGQKAGSYKQGKAYDWKKFLKMSAVPCHTLRLNPDENV